MRFEELVSKRSVAGSILAAVVMLAFGGAPAWGIEPKQGAALGDREFRAAELEIDALYLSPAGLPPDARDLALADLAALQVPLTGGRLDARGGRWASLTPAAPLVPGAGVGNELSWESLGFAPPADQAALRDTVRQAFRAYLAENAAALRIDLAEIPAFTNVVVHEGGRIAQIYQPREVDGVPVRGSYLTAVVNSGNLVLLGAERWGDVAVSKSAAIGEEVAIQAAADFALPHAVNGSWDKNELILVPLAKGGARPGEVDFGSGYTYRLAWAVRLSFAGDAGRYEALVDARSGELISFEDTNRYAEIKGGVLPVTNDGIVPDGVEQAGWPMPFDVVSTTGGDVTTDTGGNLVAAGNMTSNLDGAYIRMNDNCGPIALTQANGIDFGTSGGTDCTTPGFGGAGNTHASRTGFHELNKIVEMARGWLPANAWLQSQMTSNMNINNTCNAFWNGSTVNFYRSGGGCFNTGEIAGVFDHEWGHGMDDNDAVPTIASPSGEGIADIYTALRLNTSCIGRNFRSTVCSGFGDPCLTCTGVRDIDYLKRASGQPHDYTWSNANCGGVVHCVGAVYAEAAWSLWKRKLQQAPYNYDNNTAHEIVNRLTFIGAGNVGTWFSGGPPFGGCGASSGYKQYLAVDDDNGNLSDGTPHMTAIYDAFNDQEIACNDLTVQDSGCAGTPSTAPAVILTPGNQQIDLSWSAVAGASEYQVFRTEGVFQCDFGKVKIAATTGTTLNDSGLQNGRDYSYVVIPMGPNDSCFGPASSCATDSPVGAPDFNVSCVPSSQAIEQGTDDTATCTVISSFGYTGNVGLSCAGEPAGIGCAFVPSSVSPPANGSADSTLTLTVSGGQAVGTFNFDVVGDDGATTRSAGISVQVTPAGQNGPQDAVYNGTLGAPECAVAGSECDSTTLVESRDNLSPAEPNQPNTLDACADGTAGSYHGDESNDRIVVRTLDAYDFKEGETVEVEATVWAWSTGSSDTLDLFYAADATSPSWVLIDSIVPPGGGVQTMTAQYTLPTGALQAVRAQFRYQSTNAACSTGTYNDRDDLVFAVKPATECTVDADCADGDFCNGDEICNAGTCEAGTPPVCDDGAFCNGTESCNETTDSCDAGTPPACDDGLFCNGDESCNETTDSCDAGTVPACDDGAFCNGAESCNETTDSCDPGTPPACDDGAFCNGAESCNESTDSCDPGAPVVCDDGLFCNGTDTCNETTDSCDVGAPPVCDNGLFCDGTETCNETTDSCDAGTPPACDNGLFCDGTEICNETTDSCDAGTPPTCDNGLFCDGAEICNEATDSCDPGTPVVCDDGVFCDGAESCDEGSDSCVPGLPPSCDDGVGCTDDGCNVGTDSCQNVANNANCDNGQFCDGVETCDAILDCQAGGDPCPGQSCNEAADICEPVGPTPRLEAGTVTAGATPVTVNLTNFYISPVVVTTMQYRNNTQPTVTRVGNVTGTGFDLRLQNPSGGAVAAESVSYLVVEEGSWNIDGFQVEAQKVTSTITDENNSWVGQAQSYLGGYTNPVVLGQVMSENDPAWSVFWDRGTSRTSPPTATSLTTGKTVCQDTLTTRADETLGIVVFEAGHGTIGGVEFEAALGADTIRGVSNAPPYAYAFTTPFASAPTVGLATMAAMDGGDGGWAQIHGPAVATTTSLYLSIDEDTIADAERGHTTEQVAYAVFAGPVVYPSSPECAIDADCDDGLFCNGAETCNAGFCQAGSAPSCDDGEFCNGAESCNESTDSCDAGTPPACDDGLYCNGTESCNESTDSCDAGAPVICEDGLFCNGAESATSRPTAATPAPTRAWAAPATRAPTPVRASASWSGARSTWGPPRPPSTWPTATPARWWSPRCSTPTTPCRWSPGSATSPARASTSACRTPGPERSRPTT